MLRCSKTDFEKVDFSCGNPILETMAIALDRRLVRLCRHLSKNINCEAERWRVISWRFSGGKTANSRVFFADTHK